MDTKIVEIVRQDDGNELGIYIFKGQEISEDRIKEIYREWLNEDKHDDEYEEFEIWAENTHKDINVERIFTEKIYV